MRAATKAPLTLACLALAACGYIQGPPVTGGEPRLVHEVHSAGGARTSTSSGISTAHYFEVSREALAHPGQLEAWFRWRCTQTYISARCEIFAWPLGEGLRRDALFPRDYDNLVVRYSRDATGEHFQVAPQAY